MTASTAIAADAVYQAPQAPVAAEVQTFSWTGFTAGVQTGYSWTNQASRALRRLVPWALISTAEFWARLSVTITSSATTGFSVLKAHSKAKRVTALSLFWLLLHMNMVWTGRAPFARADYALDHALVYGTAGWAIGRGYLTVPGAGEEKETFNGFTVGAGVDYAFTDTIFGRVGYRNTNFGDKDYDFNGGPLLKVDIDQHAVRVGLGVKF